MELALTFGAFGDLVSLGVLIKDIIACLNDCCGSAKEYQDLVRSLVTLDSALCEVDQTFRNPRRPTSSQPLCATALKSIQQIQETLKTFSEKLQKYRTSLNPGGSGNRIKDVARKIQFKLEEKDVAKFRGEVTGYTIALKILMEAMTLHTLEQNHDEVTKTLANISGESQQARKDLEATSRTLMSCVTGVGRQIIEKVGFLTQTTLDIKASLSQVATTVLSLSVELSSFRFLLMSFRQGPVDEYYFTVEDALGRVFPVHLNTITSWEAFAFVMSERFKGAPGAHRVRNKRYRLIEHATRREVDQTKNWKKAFRPHQKVVMSLLCKDTDQASGSTDKLTTCPWCKTESESDTTTQVQCRGCNMFFTRIVELEDMALPPQPSGSSRDVPQFGRPSFNVQPPPGWSGKKKRKRPPNEDNAKGSDRKRHKSETSKKRTRMDNDESNTESEDEDIDGLVRVTMISRRKRIKVFQVSSNDQTTTQPSRLGFEGIPGWPSVAGGSPSGGVLGAAGGVGLFERATMGPSFSVSVNPLEYQKTLPLPDDEEEDNDSAESLFSDPANSPKAATVGQLERSRGTTPPSRAASDVHDSKGLPPPPAHGLVGDSAPLHEKASLGGSRPYGAGNVLVGRYEIVEMMGSSTSYKIIRAVDLKEKRNFVLIKILFQHPRDTWYPETKDPTIIQEKLEVKPIWPSKLIDRFDLAGCRYLVVRAYGQSLHQLIPGRSSGLLDPKQIQSISRQLFGTLALLHDSNIQTDHWSLGTENVLLINSDYEIKDVRARPIPSVSNLEHAISSQQLVLHDTDVQVKLEPGETAEFESSNAERLSQLNKRCQPPEATVSNNRDPHAGHIWNVGCIMLKMLTDDFRFMHVYLTDDREHLAVAEKLCGSKINRDTLRWVEDSFHAPYSNSSRWFRDDGTLDYPLHTTTLEELKFINSVKRAEAVVPPSSYGGPFFDHLRDLLKRIFVLDPAERIMAKEALAHPWFLEEVPTST